MNSRGDRPAPVLVVIGGLPGTGKTTIARAVASRLRAAHVRIDAIETALVAAGLAAHQHALGPAGYIAAHRVAQSCLEAGTDTVVDAVHPVPESRAGWPSLAKGTGAGLLTVLLRCDDPAEHERRVSERRADLPDQVVPTWAAVSAMTMEPWPEVTLELDTRAGLPPAVDAVLAAAERARQEALQQR